MTTIKCIGLDATENFQLEQAIAVECKCNMADVSISYSGCDIFVHFFVDGKRACFSFTKSLVDDCNWWYLEARALVSGAMVFD